jgi:hypothetical protein
MYTMLSVYLVQLKVYNVIRVPDMVKVKVYNAISEPGEG